MMEVVFYATIAILGLITFRMYRMASQYKLLSTIMQGQQQFLAVLMQNMHNNAKRVSESVTDNTEVISEAVAASSTRSKAYAAKPAVDKMADIAKEMQRELQYTDEVFKQLGNARLWVTDEKGKPVTNEAIDTMIAAVYNHAQMAVRNSMKYPS